MKQKQGGFTLIELIVVIVILGILAATALPKFADLQQDARLASVEGALGSVNSAAAIAHSQWVVNSAVKNIEGVTVLFNSLGYPDASSVVELAGLAPNGTPAASSNYNIVITASAAGMSGGIVEVSPLGAQTPSSCMFVYSAGSMATGSTTGPLITGDGYPEIYPFGGASGTAITRTNC